MADANCSRLQPSLPYPPVNDSPTACQSTLKLSSALSQERHSQAGTRLERKKRREICGGDFGPPRAISAAIRRKRRPLDQPTPRDQNAAREGARRVPGTPPFRSHASLVEAGRSARGFLLGCVPRPARKSSSGRSAPRALTRAKMTAEEPEKLYRFLLKFYLPTVPHFRCAIMRRTYSPGAARAVLVLNLPLYEGTLIGSAAKYLDEVWPRNGQPRRYCVVARNLGDS
jgi:hypothetical protein